MSHHDLPILSCFFFLRLFRMNHHQGARTALACRSCPPLPACSLRKLTLAYVLYVHHTDSLTAGIVGRSSATTLTTTAPVSTTPFSSSTTVVGTASNATSAMTTTPTTSGTVADTTSTTLKFAAANELAVLSLGVVVVVFSSLL